MQKIRKFPQPNLEKIAKNPIFKPQNPILGPKMPHFGPKRAKKNFPKKIVFVTFQYLSFSNFMQKIREF